MGHTLTDTHSIVSDNLVGIHEQDFGKSASEAPVEEKTSYSSSMDFEEETSFEFWPVQHPAEPPEEDRPVECPVPIPADSQHKLSERLQRNSSGEKRLDRVLPIPIRATRKRHHGEQQMTNHQLLGRRSLDQLLPPQGNVTMFQMINK